MKTKNLALADAKAVMTLSEFNSFAKSCSHDSNTGDKRRYC